MNKKEIAMSIWRSGFLRSGNKIKQRAREDMRRLIANDISALLPEKERDQFIKDCKLN